MTEIEKFEKVLANELTPGLAGLYVQGLVNTLGKERMIEKGEEWHFEIGKNLYGPLAVGFCQWVEEYCQGIRHGGAVHFALRDAAPLQESANVQWDGKMIYPVGIYVNRPLLGIEDEIAPQEASVDGNMRVYLGALGLLSSSNVVWADTGAWGTVIKVLKQGLLKDVNLHPLFWFSHNPGIPGYINHLLKEAALNPCLGEVINDSLECVFPQQYQRPLEVVQDKVGWRVNLEHNNPIAVTWGRAALAGVKAAARELSGITRAQEIVAINKLAEAHEGAKTGGCTGVLPQNTPTWSKGEQFLAEWPKGLLP